MDLRSLMNFSFPLFILLKKEKRNSLTISEFSVLSRDRGQVKRHQMWGGFIARLIKRRQNQYLNNENALYLALIGRLLSLKSTIACQVRVGKKEVTNIRVLTP
mmetsp:Transcript_10410/g.15458  ORF Transcript_10410/g.15458 Transcript_10410/m.15458 type:complete len:103 (-) Transcript_10410:137-445(-)